MKNESLTSRAARPEIEKFADEAFAVARDRILAKHRAERVQVLAKVQLTHNSGGYVPALVRWAADSVREMILARADAYVEAFELHNVPSDARAETEFKRAAQQMAGGTISGIRGELNLLQARTKRHLGHQGARLNLEIEAAARSALEEGALRLRRQRIKAESPSKFGADVARFGLSLNQRTTVESGSNPTRTGGEAEIIVFMQLVEKWRMTAGEHGGKLTQKQVAAKMKLDLRAYSAAKKGEPRGKDHPGRVRKFARDLGLI